MDVELRNYPVQTLYPRWGERGRVGVARARHDLPNRDDNSQGCQYIADPPATSNNLHTIHVPMVNSRISS